MSETTRILLIEDVFYDAELIKRELRKANISFVAHTAQSKDEFVRGLRQFNPDAIICDFSLGQFNALDALKLLKSEAPDLPFILVTGSQSEEVAVACIKQGADDYILKASLKRLPSALLAALQRKQAERNRLEAEERIREQAALLDKAQDAILVHDLENRITYWNKSAERLYGWSTDEVLGRQVDELIDKKDSSAAAEARATAQQQGEWHGELWQITKSGYEIVVESRCTLVTTAESLPKGMLVINTDITERKRLEAQFLRVQRMESIGTLAGGLAHDLNNVLTPILMAIRMLREHVDGAGAQEILNTLETSAQRGSAIVQQLLSFARGVEGERSLLQVKHPLNEVVAIARDTFPRSIQIVTQLQPDLWPVMGDPTQLHQVFMNICVNARDAMPNGGRLQIEADNRCIDENYAQMQPDAKPGQYVVITFSDTGMGIPPALLPKIFEPFFTTKESGKGTGLGLSTAAGLIKGHGGFLTVYSEVGKGSRFRVHIPAVEFVEQLQPPKPTSELPVGSGELILVADDELAIREIIKVTLEANKYRVITANDGTEAVATFAEHKGEVRAAIVDIMMPYMDGPATIRALQKMSPSLKFLAVSGLMNSDKTSDLPEGSHVAFLAKPFTSEQLLVTLRDLLHQNPVSPSRS